MGGGSRIPKVQQLLLEYTGKYVDGHNKSFNPLVPSVHWKVTHTLFKYVVWPFSGHQVLKG